MWYLMHENDQKHYVKENSDRIVTVIDPTTNKETLRVTFTPQDNGRILMQTKYPLTYMYADKEMSAPKDAYLCFSCDRELVLLSDSAETPRITVRMVKLDPQDWPTTPPPEHKTRAPTLPYDALVLPAPPPSPTPPQEAYVRGTTLPFNPRDAPLPVDPAPPPAQGRKKPKKPRREFHMCA